MAAERPRPEEELTDAERHQLATRLPAPDRDPAADEPATDDATLGIDNTDTALGPEDRSSEVE